MTFLKLFAYWFVGANIVITVIFSIICLIFGGRDLARMLREIDSAPTDDSDDGRVTTPGVTVDEANRTR